MTKQPMKLLFLSQGKTISDHPGWDYSFRKLVDKGTLSEYFNIPYYNWEGRWLELWDHIVELCDKESINLVYFHYYHRRINPDPTACILSLKALKHQPTVFTSAGDPFSLDTMMPDYPKTFKTCARICDLTFCTQMGKAADKMMSWGIKNIVLSPNSVCPVRFANNWNTDPKKQNFDFDLVMVGSKNGPRPNPINRHYWAFRKRKSIVKALNKRYGKRFGLFGHGWKGYECWQGSIPFNEQQQAFRRGRIAIDGFPYSMADYYSSNRPFFMIASAIPTITYSVPRLNKIFRADDHCYYYKNIPDLLNLCDRLLETDTKDLYTRANKAARYVEEKHTQYHRAKFIIENVMQYHKDKASNKRRIPLHFPFFLNEVDQKNEQKFAVRNWRD